MTSRIGKLNLHEALSYQMHVGHYQEHTSASYFDQYTKEEDIWKHQTKIYMNGETLNNLKCRRIISDMRAVLALRRTTIYPC